KLQPKAVILPGMPATTTDPSGWVLEQNLPVLAIGAGMRVLSSALGGKVQTGNDNDAPTTTIKLTQSGQETALFDAMPGTLDVRMQQGEIVTTPPEGFAVLATAPDASIAAIGKDHVVALAFHPEDQRTQNGTQIIRNFLTKIAGCDANWSPQAFVDAAITEIREQVGDGRVLLGLSGGDDSSVAAALIHRAIGNQLTPVFVNNGLLRLNEAELVRETFTKAFDTNLVYADASEQFLTKLRGVTDPEHKRTII